MAASAAEVSCDDFLEFQESLKRMRIIDDKIVYALNSTIPTESFRAQYNVSQDCKNLYEQLDNAYQQREAVIKTCITRVSAKVKNLKERNETKPDDIALLKSLRKEQTKLRLMQSEVNIEEVVKDRSLKIFYEKCKFHYKPETLKQSS